MAKTNQIEKIDVFVTVVAMLRNSRETVDRFVRDVHRILEHRYTNFELLLVDDASTDGTQEVVKSLLSRLRCVRFLQTSRHMGIEVALTAGLDSAIGDFVVTMNPDSDPAEKIVEMVELCRSGYDLVQGVSDRVPRHKVVFRLLRRAYLLVCRWMIKVDLTPGATCFRVLSRYAINQLTRVRPRRSHFAVLSHEIGYKTAMFNYQRVRGSQTRSRVSWTGAVRLGVSILLRHSVLPLRIASLLGIAGSVLSAVYPLYVVMVYLSQENISPGWTTLSLQVSGLFLLVFVMLFLMSEYMTRLIEESSNRPLYHLIRDEQSSVMVSDQAQCNVLEDPVHDTPLRAGEQDDSNPHE